MKHAASYVSALVFLFLAATHPQLHADVRLPKILSQGLVLQRDTPNKIWGWADAGEQITLRLEGREIGSVVAESGKWLFLIDAMPAGGPYNLEIIGNNRVVIEDVYFGEVWVASGQSNMQLPMERVREKYADQITAAHYPLIRMFTVPRVYNFEGPQDDVGAGQWLAANPDSVLDFSAVAFFFARELFADLNVAIGIISSNYGGAPAEAWMSEEALQDYPHYLDLAQSYRDEAYLQSLLDADKAQSDAWYRNADDQDAGLQASPRWFDDSIQTDSWETMDMPAFFADGDLGPINGVVWFRKEFTLPASAAGQAGQLLLGAMVDADITYVNGVQVGNTTYQYPPRRYAIGENILRAGKNTVTVRLISNIGKGGFVRDKPYWIRVGDTQVDLAGPWRYRVGMISQALPAPRFLNYKQPLGFYNAMLAPLLNLSIRGVIWYQGESNTDRPMEYAQLFPAMIRDWRKQWNQGDFPFVFVQLANFMEAKEVPQDSQWAETREAQRQALSEPNTAMAVSIDVGEWNDVHPLNKQAVGHRLALAARKLAYGEDTVVHSGPTFHSMNISGNRITLEFENQGSGLMVDGDRLLGFAIAGEDGNYVWAEAEIQNGQVQVWSEAVDGPLMVRYAWADNPDTANLYNLEGLPASPFQASQK